MIDLNEQCRHSRTEIRHRIASNGAPFVKHQCLTCGRPIGGHIAHNKLQWRPVDYPPWDESLANAYMQRRYAEIDRRRDANNRAFWLWYDSYLTTPAWKDRRRKVLKRAGGICEACGDAEAGQVHHTTYEHAGAEPLWELRAVCNDCHDALHDYVKPWEADSAGL